MNVLCLYRDPAPSPLQQYGSLGPSRPLWRYYGPRLLFEASAAALTSRYGCFL